MSSRRIDSRTIVSHHDFQPLEVTVLFQQGDRGTVPDDFEAKRLAGLLKSVVGGIGDIAPAAVKDLFRNDLKNEKARVRRQKIRAVPSLGLAVG